MTPGFPRSRELTEAAAPGGGLAAATVLALALAWANVAPPNAMADFELPFLVRACPHLHITCWRCYGVFVQGMAGSGAVLRPVVFAIWLAGNAV